MSNHELEPAERYLNGDIGLEAYAEIVDQQAKKMAEQDLERRIRYFEEFEEDNSQIKEE